MSGGLNGKEDEGATHGVSHSSSQAEQQSGPCLELLYRALSFHFLFSEANGRKYLLDGATKQGFQFTTVPCSFVQIPQFYLAIQ